MKWYERLQEIQGLIKINLSSSKFYSGCKETTMYTALESVFLTP